MPLKRPFLQLASIQWHLVVVVVNIFKDGHFYPPTFSLFFCEQKLFALFDLLKMFYFTGFPVKFFLPALSTQKPCFQGTFLFYWS